MTRNKDTLGTDDRKQWISPAVLAAGLMTIIDGTGTGATYTMAGT